MRTASRRMAEKQTGMRTGRETGRAPDLLRRRLGMAVVMTGVLIAAVDSTIVVLALPAMPRTGRPDAQ
jgi:hypothetical protein